MIIFCCRLRKAEKKKRKGPIHIKNPVKKKDPKKLMLIELQEKLAQEGSPHTKESLISSFASPH